MINKGRERERGERGRGEGSDLRGEEGRGGVARKKYDTLSSIAHNGLVAKTRI